MVTAKPHREMREPGRDSSIPDKEPAQSWKEPLHPSGHLRNPSMERPAPLQEALAPAKETPHPSRDLSTPSREKPNPYRESTKPSRETPIPRQELRNPGQETTIPGKEMTVPNDGILQDAAETKLFTPKFQRLRVPQAARALTGQMPGAFAPFQCFSFQRFRRTRIRERAVILRLLRSETR